MYFKYFTFNFNWGLRTGGSLVNLLQIEQGQTCFIHHQERVTVFFFFGKERKITPGRLVDSHLFSRTTRFRFFTNLFSCCLRLHNFKLNITQGKVEKFLNSVSATMTSDNNLLLIISGDEDVDYTTPKTPSYCASTDIEEHMMLTKTKPAVTSHSPQAHLRLSISCASMPIFKFSPCNNTPQNFKTAFCTDAVM